VIGHFEDAVALEKERFLPFVNVLVAHLSSMANNRFYIFLTPYYHNTPLTYKVSS